LGVLSQVVLDVIDEGLDLEMNVLSCKNSPGSYPGKVVPKAAGGKVIGEDVGAGKWCHNNTQNGPQSIDPGPESMFSDARPHELVQLSPGFGRVRTGSVVNRQFRGVSELGAEAFVIGKFADQIAVGFVDASLELTYSARTRGHFMIIAVFLSDGMHISLKGLKQKQVHGAVYCF
jgi:hypothetical protein